LTHTMVGTWTLLDTPDFGLDVFFIKLSPKANSTGGHTRVDVRHRFVRGARRAGVSLDCSFARRPRRAILEPHSFEKRTPSRVAVNIAQQYLCLDLD
jgi:hypothetical protein